MAVSVTFEDPAQWRTWSRSHGQMAMWESVPESDREDVMATAAERLDAARGPDGRITLTQQVRLSLGERTEPG